MKEKLNKIKSDAEKGLKLKSVDQLKNLINTYPNDLELRNSLANLYFQSGFLDAAGKYWILTDPRNDNIMNCVNLYELSKNYSGHQILREIQFKGDKSELTEYARKKLNKLENKSKSETGWIPKSTNNFQKPKIPITPYKETFEDKMAWIWAYVLILLLAILILIGIYASVRWIFF